MSDRRDLRAILGGRWAISARAYLWLAPLATLSVTSGEIAKSENSPWIAWTIASALGYCLTGLVLLGAHLTWFKNRTAAPKAIWEVVLLGAIAGTVKGFTTGTLAALFTSVPLTQSDAWSRVPTAALAGVIDIVFGAVLMSAIERVDQSRFTLLDERIRYSQLQLQEEQLSAAMRRVAIQDVQNDLQRALSAVQNLLDRTDQQSVETQWRRLSESIIDAAQNEVRALSHELWQQASRTERQRLSLRDLVSLSLRKRPLHPGIVSVIYILTQISLVSSWQPLPVTAAVSAVDVLVIFLVERILRTARSAMGTHTTAWTIATLAVTAVGFAAQPALLGFLSWDRVLPTLVPLNVVWFVTLCLASSLWDTAMTHPDAMLEDLQRDVSDGRVRAAAAQRETKRLSGELAKFVHGTLQSRLMVAALYAGDPEKRQDPNLRTQLRQTVESPMQEFLQAPAVSLNQAVERTQASWAGLVDVHSNLQLAGHLTATDTEYIAAVVDEAVANASRHGWADRVWISVTSDEHVLRLTVRDNGIGPRIGEPGLGTSLYNADPRADWTIEAHTEGGAVLQLDLQLRPPRTAG